MHASRSDRADLERRSLADLHALAAERGVPRFRAMRREQLIDALAGGESRGVEIDELEELEGLDEHPRERMTGGPPGHALGEQLHADPGEARHMTEREPRDWREEVDSARELEREPAQPSGREPVEAREREPVEAREREPAESRTGVLDIVPDGFGFVRIEGFARSRDDVFVSRSQVRSLGLRQGDEVSGPLRPLRRSDRHASLAEVETVNGTPASELGERPSFDALTPVFPSERLPLALGPGDVGLRMLDLMAPLWKGQRYLIASPPRAGATTLLRDVVRSAAAAGTTPVVLLVDARPEEVTDWAGAVDVPVHAAASDRSAEAQVQLVALALERAKRLVEQGRDVLLAIDSISRLARAHSLSRHRGRRRDGADGVEAEGAGAAVQAAKRLFSTARNTEEAGSLTIVATASVESGSALEALLHEALADVASAELRLGDEIARAGLFPAIDARRSFARFEGEAAADDGAERHRRLGHSLEPLRPTEAWKHLADHIRETGSNEQILAAVWGGF